MEGINGTVGTEKQIRMMGHGVNLYQSCKSDASDNETRMTEKDQSGQHSLWS